MNALLTRRDLLRAAGAAGFALAATEGTAMAAPRFEISLAEWSLHRTLRAGKLDNLDFARVTRHDFGIGAVEYVNQFFKDKARDAAYLKDLNRRAADHDVKQLLIMCDGEGNMGDSDRAKRAQAVANHEQWVDAAHALGCHSIRINAHGTGTPEEVSDRVAESCAKLVAYAHQAKINVIIENHGGNSSNPDWLVGVMKKVNHPRFGTLPDFGNFQEHDRYEGVTKFMPYARGVSAKSHEFDAEGSEVRTDYARMMKIVLEAGYHGYVGIEYEGSKHPEAEGIHLTKKLLERFRGA